MIVVVVNDREVDDMLLLLRADDRVTGHQTTIIVEWVVPEIPDAD